MKLQVSCRKRKRKNLLRISLDPRAVNGLRYGTVPFMGLHQTVRTFYTLRLNCHSLTCSLQASKQASTAPPVVGRDRSSPQAWGIIR